MTKRPDEASESADRPALEIEITPTMIEAGVRALNSLIAYGGARVFADDEIIRQIALAMASR